MENSKVNILESVTKEFGLLELRSDGILTFEPNPGTMKDYTVPILQEMLDVLLKFSGGKPMPYFCDNRYVLGILGKEEKKFIDNHFHEFASCFAMTISSSVTRLVANAFFKIQNQPVEMKMFKEKEEAIEWLLNQ